MASLKEVRMRIATVNNTRKITSAMKLVASSKLHKTLSALEKANAYAKNLADLSTQLVSVLPEEQLQVSFLEKRKVQHILLIAFSSNSSLCGAYNANILKQYKETIEQYLKQGLSVTLLPIGKKVEELAVKMNIPVIQGYSALLDHLNFKEVSFLAEKLMQDFTQKTYDKVEVLFHQFRSMTSLTIVTKTFLPYCLEIADSNITQKSNYLLEPSAEELVKTLIPQQLQVSLFLYFLNSLGSEYASRVIAMQVATENADKLIHELTLTYNKTRQQVITNELLDIVGGTITT